MLILKLSFLPDFLWGMATGAYQIESAANEEGRGESNRDRFCRQADAVADASNGDVACSHSHRLIDGLLKQGISYRDFIKAQLLQRQLATKRS